MRRIKTISTIMLLLCFVVSSVNAQDDNAYCIKGDPSSLVSYIKYIVDSNDLLTPKQALHKASSGRSIIKESINFGISSDHYWFVLPVKNCSFNRQQAVIRLNIQRSVHLQAYHAHKEALTTLFNSDEAGSLVNNLRRYRTLTFPFSLQAGQTSTLLIHHAGANNSSLPIQIKTKQQNEIDSLKRQEVLSSLLISIFMLITFNVIFFTVTKHPILFYNIVMQSLGLLYLWHLLGGTTVYVWGEGRIDKVASGLISISGMVTYVLFSREYFSTKKKLPNLDKYLYRLVMLGFFWVCLKFASAYIDGWESSWVNFIGFIVCYACLFSASAVAVYFTTVERKSPLINKANVLVLMALLVFTANSLIMTLRVAGILPASQNTEIIYGSLLLLDVTLIAFALILRIRHIHSEQQKNLLKVNRLQRKTIEQQREAQNLIEQKVIADESATQAGRLVLSMGHDARQMLGSISNYTEVISISKDSEAKTKARDAITQSIDTLDDIISNALVLSNDQLNTETSLEWFALSRLCNPLALIYQHKAIQKGLSLKFRYRDLELYSDRILVLRIMSNLINNAIENTTHGGILVGARTREQHIVLQVWDTGHGMDKEMIQSVLNYQPRLDSNDLAETTLHKKNNLGIGLHVSIFGAKKIGANINIKSRLKKGTLMEVVLPVKKNSVN